MEDFDCVRPWLQTPKWHPRYWFGYRMRRLHIPWLALTESDTFWEYATYGACARQFLKDQFDLPDATPTTSAILFE